MEDQKIKTALSLVAIALCAGISVVYIEAWSLEMWEIMAQLDATLIQ